MTNGWPEDREARLVYLRDKVYALEKSGLTNHRSKQLSLLLAGLISLSLITMAFLSFSLLMAGKSEFLTNKQSFVRGYYWSIVLCLRTCDEERKANGDIYIPEKVDDLRDELKLFKVRIPSELAGKQLVQARLLNGSLLGKNALFDVRLHEEEQAIYVRLIDGREQKKRSKFMNAKMVLMYTGL